MGDTNMQHNNGSAMASKISSIAMVLSIFFFFIVVIILLFFYVYIHFFWMRRSLARRREARARSIFAAGEPTIPTVGLDPSVLVSLPVSVYRSNDFKEGLECAVCLSELADGEKARLLPNCNHGFHLECIDMWFHSHSTCPLCRRPVRGEDGVQLSESVCLDIEISSLPPMRSPVNLNLGALPRIASGGKMIGSSCHSSPRVSDVELGLAGNEEVNEEGSSVFVDSPRGENRV